MADLENSVSPTPRWIVDLVLTAAAATTPTGRSLRAKTWKVLMYLACIGPKGSYPGDDAAGLTLGMSAFSVSRHRDTLRSVGLVEFTGNQGALFFELRSISGGPPEEVPEEVPEAPKPKTVKFTPEVSAWFLTQPDRMDLYLRFGLEAFGKTAEECAANLKPSGTDWQQFTSDPVRVFNADLWKTSHYMGYYWHWVCKWRAFYNIELTFPQWNRLAGEISNLLKTMSPRQAYEYIYVVGNHFDLIKFRAGKIGAGFLMSENSLGHGVIKQQALYLNSLNNEQWAAEYERMRNPPTPFQRTPGGEVNV